MLINIFSFSSDDQVLSYMHYSASLHAVTIIIIIIIMNFYSPVSLGSHFSVVHL